MSTDESAAYTYVKAELDGLLESWQQRLGLSHYLIEIVYLDAYRDPEDTADVTPAECVAQWAGLRALIKVYLPMVAGYTASKLEHLMVHELSHVLLAPEQDMLKPSQAGQMELATESVARALLNVGSGRLGV